MYLGPGCTSTSTCRDRAKCSMTSCISCVNCSVESSGAEGRVGRAGHEAGETGRAGCDGRDVSDDTGGRGVEFKRAGDGDGGGGGGGGVETTGHPARAQSLIMRSLRAAGAIGISCPACPSTSPSRLLILTTPSSRSVRKSTHFRR